MKKIVLPLIALFISALSFSQQTIIKNYESQDLQDVRNLKIHIPNGYTKDTTLNYPLTIVLGDNHLFDLTVGNAKLFAKADISPKQIIVGIDMDKSYDKDISLIKANSELTQHSQNFYAFIKEELIPYTENNYRTSPFLTIIAEGKAANFATHFFKEADPLFNAYVCLNPSFAPDINKQIDAYSLARYGQMDNSFYFFTNSNQFFSKNQEMLYETLKTQLKDLNLKNLSIQFKDNKTASNKLTTITKGISDAFPQIFEAYSGISKEEFNDKIKDLAPLDAIGYLENKYLDIEYLFGTNIGIRKRDIFAIEGIVIDKENGDYLKIFGEMIQKLYPKSHLGDYYIGKYFELGKDYKKALYYYKIAYGKMSPTDPNTDLFYKNIERVAGL